MAKVAIITGAGQGIGKACAEKIANKGNNVVIADLNIELAEKTAEEIAKKYNVEAIAIKVNVADNDSCVEMVNKTIEKFGTVDILINNAGICKNIKPFEEVDDAEWDLILNVNLRGTINCSRAVIPTMKDKKYGRIVNMASMAGELGGIAVSPAYSVSKAGVICLTKSLAKYLGPIGDITCNAIAPGLIATEMQSKLNTDVSAVPLRRQGTPEEVGDVAAWLSSDESSYVSGMTIDVNGAQYLR